MKVKPCFKALSIWVSLSRVLYLFAIMLGFLYGAMAFSEGTSIYLVLSFSILIFAWLNTVYMKQRSVFENQKYLFTVEKAGDSDEDQYNLKGYIVQDSRRYKCQMRSGQEHKIGDKIEVRVWRFPVFGAFIVGEEWDF